MKRFGLFLIGLAVASAAGAQSYPSHPVRLITGYAPGGIGGLLSMAYGDQLSRQLKQPVIVEARPGASNTIGARAAMAAAPDGYTLHIGGVNAHPILVKNGVDLMKEMDPVGVAAIAPLLFITTATKPLKTVADVVAYAKANPGRLDFASSGGGAALNLMMALFSDRTGITYTHIPFKGTSEIQTAIIRGDVQITLLSAVSSLPIVSSGKAHAVLMPAEQRSPLLPDVPTPTELGLKPFAVDTILAVWAPKGTPADVIAKLNAATRAVAAEPTYIASVRDKAGVPPVALTVDQTKALFARRVAELEEAIRIAKYHPE